MPNKINHQLLNSCSVQLEEFGINDCNHCLIIGFSAGVDSCVLAHVLHLLKQSGKIKCALKLVHVNHNLQAQAPLWQQQAAEFAKSFKLELICKSVNIATVKGQSTESVARAMRYRAYCQVAAPLSERLNVVLVTAHHLDDQAETFILQLARGAGAKGLGAMRSIKSWQFQHCGLKHNVNAQHWRPLLEFSKAQLLDYAVAKKLTWVEDPSNLDSSFDRNFVRNKVLPLLTSRWQNISHSIVKSTHNLQLEHDLLNRHLRPQLLCLANGWVLNSDCLGDKNQSLVLIRLWLSDLNISMPSTAQLLELLKMIAASKGLLRWYDFQQGTHCELRVYRNLVFAYSKLCWQPWDKAQAASMFASWQLKKQFPKQIGAQKLPALDWSEVVLPPENSEYVISFNPVATKRVHWQHKTQSESVKNVFARWGVPPWLRCCCPVLQYKDKIIAIVNLHEYGYE